MPAYGSTASYDGEYTVLDGQDCRASRWNATLLRGGYPGLVEVAYVPALLCSRRFGLPARGVFEHFRAMF